MNKYRDKSDFEINKAVAEITIYGDWYLSPTDERPFTFFNYGINSSKTVELPDYCNNPADAMPIINEYGISLIYQEGEFQFATNDGNIECSISNPLKAAMIIFLMMKDAENES